MGLPNSYLLPDAPVFGCRLCDAGAGVASAEVSDDTLLEARERTPLAQDAVAVDIVGGKHDRAAIPKWLPFLQQRVDQGAVIPLDVDVGLPQLWQMPVRCCRSMK